MTYTSCFIGIPLPREYQSEFENLLKALGALSSDFRLVKPQTPHITLYYLSAQSQYHLEEIVDRVKEVVETLRFSEVTIHGFGVFDLKVPRVIYLNADCSKQIADINIMLRQTLTPYYAADNDLPFRTHMTIARLPTDKARRAFEQNKTRIETLCQSVTWHFPVKELVVYGVDSTQEPEYHQRLFSIKVA